MTKIELLIFGGVFELLQFISRTIIQHGKTCTVCLSIFLVYENTKRRLIKSISQILELGPLNVDLCVFALNKFTMIFCCYI